jgi:hypothetical protein
MQQKSALLSVSAAGDDTTSTGERSVLLSLLRGARLTCLAWGIGGMFRRYLKVADECPACGEALHHTITAPMMHRPISPSSLSDFVAALGNDRGR